MHVIAAAIRPETLRCEYAVDPIGLDTPEPRLSWTLASGVRDQVQTAYQIRVASSPERLAAGDADLWDSGRVASGEFVHIPYAGAPLRSGTRCHWQVRVWDAAGNPSPYSPPAVWEMGLMADGDWHAAWIAVDTSETQGLPTLEGCPWVWSPGRDPSAPLSTACLRRTLELPDVPVRRALFLVTADQGFTLYANGHEVARGTYWKVPQWTDLAPYLHPGANLLALEARKGHGAAGIIGRLVVEPERGEPITLTIDSAWQAAAQGQPGWQRDAAMGGEWAPAEQVAMHGDRPWGNVEVKPPAAPCPHLRRDFTLRGPVRGARVYATAMGVYELRINGRRVGHDHFAPGWTDYRQRVQYQTYDVTDLLEPGANAIGAILGDGWYAGDVAIFGRHHFGDYPLRLRLRLHVEYADGTAEDVASDGAWKGAAGPLRSADLIMGEHYDARLELGAWDQPGYQDGGWTAVGLVPSLPIAVVAQTGPGVQTTGHRHPVALTQPEPGVHIFDMGQNMVGRVRLRVAGPAGARVILRYGEMLNPDGTLYTANLRSARQTDVYTLRSTGAEEYEPRFTFHGFRYVEVRGYPGEPSLDTLLGVVIRSAAEETGRFACSDPLINQLQSNILWGQRGNFLSVPTDCPQRDERMGWLGDAQIFARTACFNMDLAGFFSKWMVDVADAQTEAGAFTDVAPRAGFIGAGAAAWGDAGVIVPWTVYQCYGDTRIIERHYAAMTHWIGYLEESSPGLLRKAEGYGDWLSIDADTPKDLLGTAYFAYSARLLARMAAATGRAADAERYEALFARIRTAFRQAYVQADGRIHADTQTAYLLALHMDLLPPELRAAALAHLVENIEQRGWHLSTGFVGVGYLNPTLSEGGRTDVAYRLLLADTYPSWGYPIRNGATTMWERWNSYTRETGFGDTGMNSFNHYSLGSVGEWLYRSVAGIDTDPAHPGYGHVVVHPRPGGGLSFARGEYRSVRGRIASAWSRAGDHLTLEVEIPAGTAATVHVPADSPEGVQEGQGPAAAAGGVTFLRAEAGCAVFRVGSGTYRFTARYTGESGGAAAHAGERGA